MGRIVSPIFLALAFASSAVLSPAHADDTTMLQPSTDWELRQLEDKCRLARDFGKGKDRTTLWIDKGGPGPSANLTFIGHPMRHPHGALIRVQFAPEEPVSRNYVKGKSSTGRPYISMFGVQPVMISSRDEAAANSVSAQEEESVDIAAASVSDRTNGEDWEQRWQAIQSLKLSQATIKPTSFELTSFSSASVELAQCANKLAAQLMANMEVSAGLGTPVAPVDSATWARILQRNYPVHLLRRGEEGKVSIRLTVNPEGRPTFCEVTEFSGPPSFNDIACLLLLQNAKFEPARDAKGEGLATFYFTNVTYTLN